MFNSIISKTSIVLLTFTFVSLPLQASKSDSLTEEAPNKTTPLIKPIKYGSDTRIDIEADNKSPRSLGVDIVSAVQNTPENISYEQVWRQRIDHYKVATAGLLELLSMPLNTLTSICVMGSTITASTMQYMDPNSPQFDTVKKVNLGFTIAASISSTASIWAIQESNKRHALVQTKLNVHQSTIENLQGQLDQRK